MRLIPLLAGLLALAPAASAQEKLDPRLKGLLAKPAPARVGLAGLTPAHAPERASVFLRLVPGADAAALAARFPTVSFGPAAGPVVTALVPFDDVARLAADAAVAHAQGAAPVKLNMDIARSSTQSSGIWLGAVDAVSNDFGTTLGSGVVVGIVDSGIDYKHADFFTEGSPNRTRILAIWDQTDAGGPAPGGFTKGGSHWTQAQIDDEIDGSPAGVVRQTDTNGHGTHVAGIAAGDGSATDGDVPAGTFKGIAPEAAIVMVKTDLTDTGISEGVQFILQKAAAAGKRAVINLSLGSHYGPHDGQGNLDAAVDAVAASTPVVVAMGNEQNDSVHASTTVPAAGSALFTLTQSGQSQVVLDFWFPSGDTYIVRVATSATGTSVTCNPGSDCVGASALAIGSNAIEVYNTAGSHPSAREVYIDLSRTGGLTSANWRVTLERSGTGGSGRVDGWVVTGAAFTSLMDSSGTVSSPATANHVVAVGSFCSKRVWVANDNAQYNDTDCSAGLLGDISLFSNHGPTRDGRQKPDLAAPGQRVTAALSADHSPAAATNITAQDGRHKLMRGTSMAAPVVAGALARNLQATPTLTASAARSALRSQARTDSMVTGHGAVPNYVFGYGKLNILGCGSSLATAPDAAVPSVHGPSSITWTWAALAGASSYSIAYATNPGVVFASTGNPVFLHTGLAANTTTAIRVFAVNPCGTGPGQDSASTSTLSVPLAAFTAVPHISSATLGWTPLPANPRASSAFGYRVLASTAANFGGTLFSTQTAAVTDAGLVVEGLTAFTSYYLRVGTLNEYGAPNFISGGPVFTATTLGPPAVGTFTVHSPSVIEASWGVGPNFAGLLYEAEASTASDFSGTLYSSSTYALSALFGGLAVNTTHHFRVRATTGPYAALGATATFANAPAGAAAPFTAVFETSATFAWTANGNPAGTLWRAELAADSGFGVSPQSSVTLATTATFSGLLKNTTYFTRVRALNRNGEPGELLSFYSTATLTDPPGSLGNHFSFAGASSVTVTWGALGLGNCHGYLVQGSTSSLFGGVRYEARTADCAAASLTVAGLAQDSTLYFRVGALNANSVPVYRNVGSTRTLGVVVSSTTIDPGGSLVVNHVPSVTELSNLRVAVPPGSFPGGGTLEINTTFPTGLPAPNSSQGTIRLLGSSAGADITVGGQQPALGRPLTLTFTYTQAALPADVDERAIVIGRYADGGWTLLPSAVDTTANTVTAQTDHLSIFAPLVSTPGTSLDAVQAFPIPWKPGSGDPRFDAQGVSFTNLPAGGTVRILTILGEEVRELSASAAGMALWDGLNSRGHRAGSGTYLVVLSGAGARKVLRVAVVR